MPQTNIRKYNEGKPMENVIKFSHNWNKFSDDSGKLNCKFFTTIRKPEVFSYYEQRVGELFEIFLNSNFFGKALLRDATLTALKKITPELLVLDSGTVDYKTMFEKFQVFDQCVLLLFERVE
jgi:hypothetical protein